MLEAVSPDVRPKQPSIRSSRATLRTAWGKNRSAVSTLVSSAHRHTKPSPAHLARPTKVTLRACGTADGSCGRGACLRKVRDSVGLPSRAGEKALVLLTKGAKSSVGEHEAREAAHQCMRICYEFKTDLPSPSCHRGARRLVMDHLS